MFGRIRRWFAAPDLAGNEEMARSGTLLNGMLWVTLGALVVVSIITGRHSWAFALPVLAGLVVLLALGHLGHVRLSSTLLVAVLWGSATYLVLAGGGIRNFAVTGYFLAIATGSLLLGKSAAIVLGVLSILGVTSVYWIESSGMMVTVSRPIPGLADLATLIATLSLTSVLLYVAVRSIEDAFDRARHSTAALTESNRALEDIRTSLERRVEERVRDLQSANQVSRLTTAVLDLERLLPQVVEVVRERFELYYVGIFMVDEGRGRAVLCAGTGDPGQQMLAREWSLSVGGKSMIGQCVARDEARIALDVGEEAVRFDNPYLPHTRSEMALPLRARGSVLGAMTIQSDEPSRFDQGDIAVMQGIADQVAVSIDNARLISEYHIALRDMEAAQRRLVSRSWSEYLEASASVSYETKPLGGGSLGDSVAEEIHRALAEEGITVVRTSEVESPDPSRRAYAALVSPITMRGEVIGVLGIHDDDVGRHWTEDDIALLEAVLERMGVLADSLRLMDDTQRRESRERLVRQITDSMRRAPDMDALIRTTVQETAGALGTSDAFLQLSTSLETVHEREDGIA